jgi:uncharacterized protein YwgA
MTKEGILLAGLAAGSGAAHTPVQIQKLFFILDRSIPEHIGGPHFDFSPYAYGPFDPAVYGKLEELAASGLIEIDLSEGTKRRQYRLTDAGLRSGQEILSGMDKKVAEYIRALSAWVRSLSFNQLVSAIYQKYPDMKANSVFKG